VTPEHTRRARELLGAAPLLAPEQHVLVDPDPERARALARRALEYYLRLSNYVASFRRLGFSDADVAGGGSDALVDALVAHGSAGVVAGRVREHLEAGADHVAVNLVPHEDEDPAETLGELAGALGL
jgi:probable F420-dependent oxidoreductase